MAQYKQPKRKKYRYRRKKGRGAAVVILTAAIVLAMGFAISLFFKVGNIEVSGAQVCKVTDIILASGIQTGDSLFFTNKSTVVRNIISDQPYADTVNIRRKLPNTIEIILTECKPIAYIPSGTDYWLFDAKGKLLEKKTEKPQLTLLADITPLVPIEGTRLELNEANSQKLEPLLQTLMLLDKRGFLGDVSQISYDTAAGIKIEYLKRFTVEFGLPSDMEKKMNYLSEVVSNLETNAMGTIILSGTENSENKVARFIPR